MLVNEPNKAVREETARSVRQQQCGCHFNVAYTRFFCGHPSPSLPLVPLLNRIIMVCALFQNAHRVGQHPNQSCARRNCALSTSTTQLEDVEFSCTLGGIVKTADDCTTAATVLNSMVASFADGTFVDCEMTTPTTTLTSTGTTRLHLRPQRQRPQQR